MFMIVCSCLPTFAVAAAPSLSESDVQKIGRRIWQNESGGSVDGLTSWNSGEDFASLGIGHFIWYPTGTTGPFEESFPPLVQWLVQSGAKVPDWLLQAKGCPWPNKAAFEKDHNGQRQQQLRTLLSQTVSEQTRFIMARLAAALPRMQAAAGQNAAGVARNMQLLQQSAAGNFAMIDYVNFKGDGMDAKERYAGQGWGLMQVLEQMEAADAASAPRGFANAAKAVLARRVKNSPPARNEKKWLPGWQNRCETYASAF
jgi:hypothetical protein